MIAKLEGLDMRILTVVAILLLAACSPTADGPVTDAAVTNDTSSALRLAHPDADMTAATERMMGSLNPFENDLRGLEIAIRLKDEFRTKEDGAEFEFQVTSATGEMPLNEIFVLAETSDIDSPLITAEQRAGYYIRTYALADTDKPRMHTADTTLKALKAASTGGNELRFQAIANTCVEPDMAMPETYSLTVFLRTHPDVDFVTLSEEWLADRQDTGSLSALFDPCSEAD